MMHGKLREAIDFATESLDGVFRKRSGIPYIAHPIKVMSSLILYGERSSDVLQASILHDVIEEASEISKDIIDEKFGSRVGQLVYELTDPKIKDKKELRKMKMYLVSTSYSEEAVLISASDKLDNLSDLVWEIQNNLVHPPFFERSKYYKGMFEAYCHRLNKTYDERLFRVLTDYQVYLERLNAYCKLFDEI